MNCIKKKLVVLVLAFVLLLAVGCTNYLNEEKQIYVNHSDEEITQSLKELVAPIVAKALENNKAFKNLLGLEVGKQFDGDFNVLYDMISQKETKRGLPISKVLKRNLHKDQSFEKLINSIPYLNFSIPVNFDKLGTYEGSVYVVPLRYDIDDQELII